MWDPYAEFQSARLSNGLEVHAAHWPGRPWEVMGFLIHTGANHDPIGLEGLSHFVEHLVSNNTIVPKKEIRAFFENCGGRVDLGITNYFSTQYRFFVPAEKTILAKAFSIFGQMLLSARLENFIEHERQVIIEEFHHRYPFRFILDLERHKQKVLYAGTWLERFVRPLGDPKSVRKIEKEKLQEHYDRHYTPANMSIVAVGGMHLEELLKILSESPFMMNKKGKRTPLPTLTTDITPPSETRYLFKIGKYFNTPIKIGSYRSFTKIPGNINENAIRLLQEMLNEVLNEEVIERRIWTYDIYTSLHNFRHFYEFSINCSSLVSKAIDHIEKVIETSIASMATREDLFEQVKRRALTRNFMIDPTGKAVCEIALEDLAQHQRIISLKEIANELEGVKMSDIQNLLHWLQPEWRWTCIVQPD